MDMAKSRFRYSYENGLVFEASFPGGDHVSWACVGGAETGTAGSSAAQIINLGHRRNFLHWIEQDGLTVTQVVDHGAGKVATSLVFPQGIDGKGSVQSVVLQGDIEVIP